MQQQRRVKTYGKRTTRIVTVTENSKQFHSTASSNSKSQSTTLVNQATVAPILLTPPGSDDDSEDDTKHPSSYTNLGVNGRNRTTGSMKGTKKDEFGGTAAVVTNHVVGPDVKYARRGVGHGGGPGIGNVSSSSTTNNVQNPILQATRPRRTTTAHSKSGDRSIPEIVSKDLDLTRDSRPSAATNMSRQPPSQLRSRGPDPKPKRRYIESSSSSPSASTEEISSDSSESISFGVPSLSSSAEEEESGASSGLGRRVNNNRQPMNRRRIEVVDLSDEESSEEEQKSPLRRPDTRESQPLKSKAPAPSQRDTYVNTPQIKASHLWHARNRRGTPLRKVARISLTSTESYSPGPSPISRKRALDPITSSPLTWDNTITPIAQRLQDISLDDSQAQSDRPDETGAKALNALLKIAGQSTPIEFSQFLDTFKKSGVQALSASAGLGVQRGKTRTVQRQSLRYHKIAEASYSEVFGIGDVVLKIVPLAAELERDDEEEEAESSEEEEEEEDVPFKSDPNAVLKEVTITQITGNVNSGFIRLLKLYIVSGKYPKPLLREWDEYKAEKGSESTRPDRFNERQLYAIVILPNAGIDLETYKFDKSSKGSGSNKSSTVWRDAAEIFWQVISALAGAEEKLKFEHRDLHWGQIVIQKRINPDGGDANVTATIIDLGLSRIETDEDVHFSLIEDEVFTGRGILSDGSHSDGEDEIEPDYQFDVYRMMRHHNNDEWSDFHPLSNVMWLHYLATKLLNRKGLKRPSPQARTTSTEGRKRVSLSKNHLESEWSAYQHLKNSEVRLELRLKEVIDGMQGRTSPRKAKPGPVRKQPLNSRKTGETHKSTGSTVQLESASDVVAMWLTKGW